MAGFSKTVWAPWRMEYIRSLGEEAREYGCFFCHYWAHPECDVENHVVWRDENVFVLMNRFPYTTGHLLVAPHEHLGDPVTLRAEQGHALGEATWQAVDLLRRILQPEGFNVGTNLGLCAGAGTPDHLHTHIVPRWSGDTSYMTVVGDTRVMPESLDALYCELIKHAADMNLRPTPEPGS
jgi:ATP adenylyltransferase